MSLDKSIGAKRALSYEELEAKNAILIEALEKIADPLAFPLQSSGDVERRMACAKQALQKAKEVK